MIVLAGIAIIAYLYYLYLYKKCNKYLDKIPGPPNIPILGSSMVLCSTCEVLPKFFEYYKKYGSVFKFRIGPIKHFVTFADAKSAERILSSPKYIDKSDDYKLFYPWLSTGLLTSTGEKWKKRRKLITPTFHFSILESFVEVFDRAGDKLVEKLKQTRGQIFDVFPYVGLCSLDIICESAMGVTINAQDNPEMLYVKSVKKMGQIILERIIQPLKRNNFTYQFTKTCKEEKECLKILHGFTKGVIKQRREELKTQGPKEFGVSKKQAFLDLLLQMCEENGGCVLSDDDVQEEVDTFMFEGHDTTTSAISFALHCLAINKDVQEKVRAELDEIFQGASRTITYQDLQRMAYLELVIKETLRIYPSVPFFSRALREDTNFDGMMLPKGCTISIIPFIIHRDPSVFPDPDKFNPERFRDATYKSAYSYIPFSAGPRNCIGQKIAMLVIKTVLAKIVMSYKISSSDPSHVPVIAAEAIIKSANGIRIKLEKFKTS